MVMIKPKYLFTKIALTLTALFFFSFSYSQITINGTVTSEEDIPLQFVNIGILNKNAGTISDEEGKFSITIDSSRARESLTFSHIGYMEKKVKIEELRNGGNLKIALRTDPTVLEEVLLISTKPDTLEIGTKSYSSMVVGYVRVDNDINKDIREFSKKIKLKKPSQLLDVNINLFNVNIDSASFRINIYDIKNRLPNKKINTQNVLVHTALKNGWNKFEIADYNLKFEGPIYISIEYLPKKKDVEEPFRYGGQVFGKSLTRSSSLGTWETRVGARLAMYVTVKQ